MKAHTGHQSDSAVQIYIDSTDTQKMINSSILALDSEESPTCEKSPKCDFKPETHNPSAGLHASMLHDLCSNYEKGTISKDKYMLMLKIYLEE